LGAQAFVAVCKTCQSLVQMLTGKLGMTLDEVIGTGSGSEHRNGVVNVGKRVYVGNLSWSASWQDLKDHFRQVGNVVYSCIMEEGTGRSKGCGIVEFERPSEAAAAIETLHNTVIGGRPIIVREDREDRDLKSGGSSGVALAVASLSNSKEAPVQTGGRGGGKGSGKSFSKSAGKVGPGSANVQVCKRVYVGNLSYKTSWQDLKDHFRQVGKVAYSNIMEERESGRSKGCGIVEFEMQREAAAAIKELHDSELDGRLITVREDREDHDVKGVPARRADRRPAAIPGRDGGSARSGKRKQSSSSSCGEIRVHVARRIYVGNLSYTTSWQDLKDCFRTFGSVVHAAIMEHDGRSKGSGIVEFSRPEDAARAIEEMADNELDGRPLIIREDREDRDLERGSGVKTVPVWVKVGNDDDRLPMSKRTRR